MKKYLDAARRQLRSDRKTIFFYGEGDEARLLASHGPWSKLKKTGGPAIIILPPFAEEMNRCRRLMKLTQDALAAAGHCSVSLDYFGTGDSAGEFSAARLAQWEDDVLEVCDVAKHAGATSISFLGFRFGGLLAASIAHRVSDLERIYAVAPQESFQRAMRQFVRIATTAPDLSQDNATGLRAPGAAKRLENGEIVEIGGYELSPDLYSDFMAERQANQAAASITALFVASQTNTAIALSPPEVRQLAALGNHSNDLHYTHVNDAQMWYQGIPDEPHSLPQAIADVVSGGPVSDFKIGE